MPHHTNHTCSLACPEKRVEVLTQFHAFSTQYNLYVSLRRKYFTSDRLRDGSVISLETVKWAILLAMQQSPLLDNIAEFSQFQAIYANPIKAFGPRITTIEN